MYVCSIAAFCTGRLSDRKTNRVLRSAETFFNRAVAFAKAGMDSAALRDLESALAQRPDFQEALQNRALILRRQASSDADVCTAPRDCD